MSVVGSMIANSLSIISETIKHPSRPSTLKLDTGRLTIAASGQADVIGMAQIKRVTKTELISANFKLLLIIIGAISFLSIMIEVGLAVFGKDAPTVFQLKLSDAADFGWKVGVGALVGLLAGKQA